MTLLLLPLIPLRAGLLCFATNSRAWWERLNRGAFAVIGLGFWLPGPLYELVRQTTQIIGGAP
jgi:hypothetical protein